MYKCYICGTDLTKPEHASEEQLLEERIWSEEHIIPNAFGGQISSFKLLCKKHNGVLNKLYDEFLIQRIKVKQLFKTKLDRGRKGNKYTKIKFEGVTKKNEKIRVTESSWEWIGEPEVIVTPEGDLLYAKVNTMEQAIQVLERYSKKFPGKIDVQECLKRFEWKDEYIEGGVNIANYVIGYDDRFYKSITKIAINYYLDKGHDVKYIEKAIENIENQSIPNKHAIGYHLPQHISYLKENEVSHIIYLVGNSKYKLLYCYIELYSMHSFMVVLNDDYEGEDFKEQYRYNIIEEKEVQEIIDFSLCRSPMKMYKSMEELNIFYKQYERETNIKLTRLYKICSHVRLKNMKDKSK